jgi:hypothetical protein
MMDFLIVLTTLMMQLLWKEERDVKAKKLVLYQLSFIAI